MNLVERAKNIIMTPKTEWQAIETETPNIGQIMTGYVLPLSLIPAVAKIIGLAFIGGMLSVSYSLAMGVSTFAVAVLSVYLVAYVVDFLAPNFGSQKNLGRAFQLVAYSCTPGWIAGALNIFPFLGWVVMLASLYGLYLMYLGIPPIMKTPQDKVVIFLVVAIIAVFVVYMIVGAILGSIFFTMFGVGAFSTMGWY